VEHITTVCTLYIEEHIEHLEEDEESSEEENKKDGEGKKQQR
jgi:hypothetical protein